MWDSHPCQQPMLAIQSLPTLVFGKDGESHIVHLDVEGQIYGFFDLQDLQSFDFKMFHNSHIPALPEGRHTKYAIIHSLKRAAIATFPITVKTFQLTLSDNRFGKSCKGSPFERMNDCIYGVFSFL